jgi:hypothetical protein
MKHLALVAFPVLSLAGCVRDLVQDHAACEVEVRNFIELLLRVIRLPCASLVTA